MSLVRNRGTFAHGRECSTCERREDLEPRRAHRREKLCLPGAVFRTHLILRHLRRVYKFDNISDSYDKRRWCRVSRVSLRTAVSPLPLRVRSGVRWGREGQRGSNAAPVTSKARFQIFKEPDSLGLSRNSSVQRPAFSVQVDSRTESSLPNTLAANGEARWMAGFFAHFSTVFRLASGEWRGKENRREGRYEGHDAAFGVRVLREDGGRFVSGRWCERVSRCALRVQERETRRG